MTATELAEELAALGAHIDAARCRWLELLAEFDRRGEWGEWIGATSCADWLSWRCAVGTGEAREFVRVAGRLRELRLLHAAFARGELSYSKLRLVSKVADEGSQEKLLDLASRVTTGQLQRLLRSYARVTSEEASLAHEQEFLDYEWDEDGSLIVRGRLPAEDGALLLQALEAARDSLWKRRKRERPPAAEPAGSGDAEAEVEKPRRPWRSRPKNVEAFVAMAESALAGPDRERSGGERQQIVVHVDAAALADVGDDGTDGRCELENGPAVSPETARRLACDASVIRLTERDGKQLSVGRKTRAIPPPLRRALQARDRGCRFPGCANYRFVDGHHVTHWARGGETKLDNLLLLCRRHHRLLHEGGYTVEPAGRNEWCFRDRAGSEVPPAPRPPPGSHADLREQNRKRGLTIDSDTTRNGSGERLDPGTGMDWFLACLGR